MRTGMLSLWTAATACHAGPAPDPRSGSRLESHLESQSAAAVPSTFEHHVYVWQRVWTPDVEAAVHAAEADFADRVLLAVESTERDTVWTGLWSLDGQPRRSPASSWTPDAQRHLGSVALALRWSDADRALKAGVVRDQVGRVLQRAADRGWAVSAVHLDADIPTARLPEWASVLAEVKSAHPVDLAVLTLVDHVDKPGWTALTTAVDSVVLQVHSVPLARADRPVLFDPETARRAVTAALASSAGPVFVALPTHTLTDARTGGAVRAEPATVVGWLDPTQNPLVDALAGVAWFRLPVPSAPDTWTAEALADVRAGTVPPSAIAASTGPAPEAWNAAETTRAVHLRSTGHDHSWLPTLDVCVPSGRIAVLPMDDRYRDRPGAAQCVVLEPRSDQLLAPDAQVAVALVLSDAPAELRRRGAPGSPAQ